MKFYFIRYKCLNYIFTIRNKNANTQNTCVLRTYFSVCFSKHNSHIFLIVRYLVSINFVKFIETFIT